MLAAKRLLAYVRNFGLYGLGDRNNSAWSLSAVLVVLVTIAFAVSACGGGGGGGGESGELATVRVGTAQSASDAAIYIADQKGYFEEQGIQLELIPFRSAAETVPSLGSGDLDVGGGSPSAGMYNAVARGLDLKNVADKGSHPPGNGYTAILVRNDLVDSGVFNGYEDLEGLTLGTVAEGTSAEINLVDALRQGGLTLNDAQVEYLSFPDHVSALENGSIDASSTTEPSATQAVESGAAVRWAGADELYPYQQVATIIYGPDFVEQGDLATGFMVAYLKGARDYNDALEEGRIQGPNADEIISIIAEYSNITDPELISNMVAAGIDPNGELNVDGMERDLQTWKDQGLLENEDVTAEQTVDTSFAEAAVEELGPYEPNQSE
jgi:NitT/TauT family transport system substrate-binding protein